MLPILGMDQILKLLLISRHLDTLSMTKHLTSLLLQTLQVLVKELLVEKEQVLRKEGNQVCIGDGAVGDVGGGGDGVGRGDGQGGGGGSGGGG